MWGLKVDLLVVFHMAAYGSLLVTRFSTADVISNLRESNVLSVRNIPAPRFFQVGAARTVPSGRARSVRSGIGVCQPSEALVLLWADSILPPGLRQASRSRVPTQSRSHSFLAATVWQGTANAVSITAHAKTAITHLIGLPSFKNLKFLFRSGFDYAAKTRSPLLVIKNIGSFSIQL